MAGGIKIADFFAEIGFKVRDNPLKELKGRAQDVAKSIQASASAIAKTHVKNARGFKTLVDQEGKLAQAVKTTNKARAKEDELHNSHVQKFQKVRHKAEQEELAAIKKKAQAELKAIEKKANALESAHTQAIIYDRKLTRQKEAQRLKEEERALRQRYRRDAAAARSRSAIGDSVSGIAGAGMRSLAPAAGALGIYEMGRSIFDAAQLKTKTMAALTATTSGPAEATQQYAFLNQEVDRLSLNLRDASQGFITLKGSAMGGKMAAEDVNSLFSATNEILTVYGATADDVQGTFRAFGQMMSKGQVYAEELKGQLSERVYGAVEMAAQSLGLTTQELFDKMKAGDIEAHQLLTRLDDKFRELARRNGALSKSLDSPQAKLNVFLTKLQRFWIKLGEVGALRAITKLFEVLGLTLDKIEPYLPAIVHGFKALWATLEFGWDILVAIKDTITSAFEGFPVLTTLMVAGLASVIPGLNVFLLKWLLIPMAIVAAAAGLQEMIAIMNGGESIFKKWADEDGIVGGLSASFVYLSEFIGGLITRLGVLANILGELSGDGKWSKIKQHWNAGEAELDKQDKRVMEFWHRKELREGKVALAPNQTLTGGWGAIPVSQFQAMQSLARPRLDPFGAPLPTSGVLRPEPMVVDVRVSADQQGITTFIEKTAQGRIDGMLTHDQASMAGAR